MKQKKKKRKYHDKEEWRQGFTSVFALARFHETREFAPDGLSFALRDPFCVKRRSDVVLIFKDTLLSSFSAISLIAHRISSARGWQRRVNRAFRSFLRVCPCRFTHVLSSGSCIFTRVAFSYECSYVAFHN